MCPAFLLCKNRGEAGGSIGGKYPLSTHKKKIITSSKILLDTLVAHLKPTIRGIDIIDGAKQETMFHCFNLQTFIVVVLEL
jgi:hypothetical protein